MNYRLRNDRKKPLPFRLISVAAIFVLLILAGFVFPSFSRALFRGIARPFWLGEQYVVNVSETVKIFFETKNALISQNTELRDENAALKLKQADYDILVQEN